METGSIPDKFRDLSLRKRIKTHNDYCGYIGCEFSSWYSRCLLFISWILWLRIQHPFTHSENISLKNQSDVKLSWYHCINSHDVRTTEQLCHQHHVMTLMMWGTHHNTVSACKVQYSGNNETFFSCVKTEFKASQPCKLCFQITAVIKTHRWAQIFKTKLCQ